MKKVGVIVSALMLGLLMAEPSLAEEGVGLGKSVKAVSDSIQGVPQLLGYVAYIVGVVFGIRGALKLKEWNETKGQVPLSTPIISLVIAALCIALPTLLSSGAETVFGSGSKKAGSLTNFNAIE